MSMRGKRALVTGASRGIGLAITEALLEKGVRVVGLGRNQENLDKLKEKHPEVETVCADLSDWEGTREAVSKLGHFDYLVNNAGIGKRCAFLEMDADFIDNTITVNLKAVINVSQIVANGMKESGKGGSIVNVSSVSSQKSYKKLVVYGASKAALNQLSKGMAHELGEYKIRVNVVSPGVTPTDMASVLFSQPDLVAKVNKTIPLGRYSETEDVAKAVVFLLSDEAFMINGTIVPIDGGLLTY